jgi:hypothetical protein
MTLTGRLASTSIGSRDAVSHGPITSNEELWARTKGLIQALRLRGATSELTSTRSSRLSRRR